MSNRILPPEEYGRTRRYLTLDATKTLVHALVTSRFDCCNSLLYGLPANHLAKMQRLQIACAHVITRTGRRSHITPVLKELHWLPVHRRIQYKILSHTPIVRYTTNRQCTWVIYYLSTDLHVLCGQSQPSCWPCHERELYRMVTDLLRKQRRLYGTVCLLTSEIVIAASNFKGN